MRRYSRVSETGRYRLVAFAGHELVFWRDPEARSSGG